MSTVRRQQLDEIIECLGSHLRTEMYHVLGSEALSAELRRMLAVRIHQDSGELVQRYLLSMDPGRHRSDPAVMCGIRHRRSHHHPLPLRRFRPFPVRRRFAARMPQHHLSRHGQLVSNMCLRWSRRLQRRPGGLYLVFHQCAWCRRVPLRLQRHRAQVEGAELPAHKTYQRQAAPPRVLIPKARPSRGHLSGHLRVPSPTVWSRHEKDPAHGTGSKRMRYLMLADAAQISFTHLRTAVLSRC